MGCTRGPAYESITTLQIALHYAKGKDGIEGAMLLTTASSSAFIGAQHVIDIFLKHTNFTHLMITGDDVWHPENTISKLISDDKDIVSGIYWMRNKERKKLALYIDDSENVDEYLSKGSLIRSPYSSGHTLTIKRTVVETLTKLHPELNVVVEDGSTQCYLFFPFIEDGKLYLDDWAFSKRATAAGFECWLDFGVQLKHKTEEWLEIGKKEDAKDGRD